MLRAMLVRVLGSAAGGGAPQWNCGWNRRRSCRKLATASKGCKTPMRRSWPISMFSSATFFLTPRTSRRRGRSTTGRTSICVICRNERGPVDFVVQEFTMERLRSASISIRILKSILVFALFLTIFFAPLAAAQRHSGSTATGCVVADLPRERYQTPRPAALVAATAEHRRHG